MAGRRHSEASSIFPFLSVLICTMGALILLLLVTATQIEARVVDQHLARQKGSGQGAQPVLIIPPAVEKPATPKGPSEETKKRWRRMVLDAERERDEKQEQVKAQQEKIRKAQQQLESAEAALRALQQQVARLREEKQAISSEQQDVKQEESQLEGDLEHARVKVAEKKKNLTEAKSQFALVPYDGQSGTTRRPIFLECTEHGIRILPENVLLTAPELSGFTDKYNPLLAGMDLLTKYWAGQAELHPDQNPSKEPPYVLMIVRPSGTISYYLARRYLARLRFPFGYELVEEDYPLYFPPPDPKSRTLLVKEIENTIRTRDSVLATRAKSGALKDELIVVKSLNNEENAREELEEQRLNDPTADDLPPIRAGSNLARRTGRGNGSMGPRGNGSGAGGRPVTGSRPGSGNSVGAGTGFDGEGEDGLPGGSPGGTGIADGSAGGGSPNNPPGRRLQGQPVSNVRTRPAQEASPLDSPTGQPSAGGTGGGPGGDPFANPGTGGGSNGGQPAGNGNAGGGDGYAPIGLGSEEGTGIGNGGRSSGGAGGGSEDGPLVGSPEANNGGGRGRGRGSLKSENESAPNIPRMTRNAPPAGEEGSEESLSLHGPYEGTEQPPTGTGAGAGTGSRTGQPGGRRLPAGAATRSPVARQGNTSSEGEMSPEDDSGVRLLNPGEAQPTEMEAAPNGQRQQAGAGAQRRGQNRKPAGQQGAQEEASPSSGGTPDSPLIFGAPPGGGNTSSGQASRYQHMSRQRWGRAGARGTIGLEKNVPLRITATEIIVGEKVAIPIGQGESREELSRQLLGAIDHYSSNWGDPPDTFYWIPSARVRVEQGGGPHYARVEGILQRWGITSTVEFDRQKRERE